MSITVTDLFCGAGGSSSGAEDVNGVVVRIASNHWAQAIATHNFNFPHVDHDIADVAQIDPRRYPTTDVLWASPACTFWSNAAGRKIDFDYEATKPALFDLNLGDDQDDEPEANEAKERSRALMKDVPRFAEHHRYKAVIVENTPPLLKWWYFPKWIARMRALGYKHKVLTLNSAFAHQLGQPAPQLRDRVYIVFWQERYRDPDFERWLLRPHAWCPTCDQIINALRAPKNPRRPHGAYWAQYVYRCPRASCRHGVVHPYTLPAFSALDMTNLGVRIGDRDSLGMPPLADNTLARIKAGVARYWIPDATTPDDVAGSSPMLVPVEGRDGKNVRLAEQPMRTQTARNETGLLLMPYQRTGAARPSAQPLTTQTTKDRFGLLVPAGGSRSKTATTLEAPMRTRLTRESEGVLMVPLRNNNRPKLPNEPLDTFAANGNHHGLLMRNNSSRGNGSEMSTLLTEPARTITSAGHQSLISHPQGMFAYDAARYRNWAHTPIDDIDIDLSGFRFRMLEPDEIKAGMAFAQTFTLLGSSKRNKVRMCGNAVTPPVARDLIAAVVEAITGDQVHAA